jgi:hypothetical protein
MKLAVLLDDQIAQVVAIQIAVAVVVQCAAVQSTQRFTEAATETTIGHTVTHSGPLRATNSTLPD